MASTRSLARLKGLVCLEGDGGAGAAGLGFLGGDFFGGGASGFVGEVVGVVFLMLVSTRFMFIPADFVWELSMSPFVSLEATASFDAEHPMVEKSNERW